MGPQINMVCVQSILPENCKLFLIWMGMACLLGLGILAYFAGTTGSFPGELSASKWVQSWQFPWIDAVMRAISAPGLRIAGIPFSLLALPILFFMGWRKESVLILVSTVVASGIVSVIKEMVARPRPSVGLMQASEEFAGFAFPSGHVTHYVVYLGILGALLIWAIKPKLVRAFIILIIALALVGIGVSRLYLGAHQLGDVVGGYLLGSCVAVFSISLWRMWVSRFNIDSTGE